MLVHGSVCVTGNSLEKGELGDASNTSLQLTPLVRPADKSPRHSLLLPSAVASPTQYRKTDYTDRTPHHRRLRGALLDALCRASCPLDPAAPRRGVELQARGHGALQHEQAAKRPIDPRD